MYKVIVKYNNGFKWFQDENIWVKGYFYNEDGNYFEKEKSIDYFKKALANNEFENIIGKLNGLFSVIFQHNNKLFLFTEKSRFFTLFYYQNKEGIIVSDCINELIDRKESIKINNTAALEFSGMGYVGFGETLFDGISQVQSSEYMVFKGNEIENRKILFNYSSKTFLSDSFSKLKTNTYTALQEAFDRMLNSIGDKQIVLPLSGGYDSRFIAAYLKQKNIENVICFTYGKPKHVEVEISKNVANKLGYKWYFIDHEKQEIANPGEDETLREYIDYAGQFSSMFYLSEYYAVRYLAKNKLIEDDAVFIPGHSGDLLAGSQYMKVFNNSLSYKNFIKFFISRKFVNDYLSKEKLKVLINRYNHKIAINSLKESKYDIRSIFEDQDIKEKIAKFIINSSKVFTYFGYEIRMPFWDDELMSFFRNIPYQFKREKLLYDSVLREQYFEKLNIVFNDELQPSVFAIKSQKIKDFVKKLLGKKIKFDFVKKNDWANYIHLTQKMQNEVSEKADNYEAYPPSVNSFIIQWYLLKAKEKADK